ncbi:MAG: glycosyltransferase [Anaerolineales bacterium]|nr:glycosyltransferase [Anaerolineales bacterium]MDW8162920.1 glycosyltransferase [Anaerolineales bacterium]
MIRAVCYTLSFLDEYRVDPMGHLRLVSPLSSAGIEIVRGVYANQTVPEQVLKGDIVVIQRHFPMLYKYYRKIIGLARQTNRPIVYEIDDWLLGLPPEHPDRMVHFYTPSLLPILEVILEADLVTVPTEVLRDIILPLNPNVAVLANYLDDSLWQFRDPAGEISQRKHLIIGYMGTHSHQPDLELIVPVFLELLHEFSGKLQIHFWGVEPPVALRKFPHVKHFPLSLYCYSEFAQYFQNQTADILVAPLVDNLFNRCKSPLKYFEYTALGAPSVLSAIEPYTTVIEDGKNGFLAGSLEDWRNALKKLIEDRNTRIQIARRAQKTILEKWLLSQNSYRWRDVYEKVVRGEIRNSNRVNSPFLEVVGSLNAQLFDMFQSQKNLLESQQREIGYYRQELDRLETKVQQYESEIVQYVTSRSWRYTRPFRKVDRFLRKLWASISG